MEEYLPYLDHLNLKRTFPSLGNLEADLSFLPDPRKEVPNFRKFGNDVQALVDIAQSQRPTDFLSLGKSVIGSMSRSGIDPMSSLRDFTERIPELDDLGFKDILDFRGLESLGENSNQIPGGNTLGLNYSGKDILNLGRQYFGGDYNISDLRDIAMKIPELSDLNKEVADMGRQYFGGDYSISDLHDIAINIPELSDLKKDVANMGRQYLEEAFPELRNIPGSIAELGKFEKNLPSLDELAKRVGLSDIKYENLSDIKHSFEQVSDVVESISGISPTDLISNLPGADILGFGQDEDGDSSDGSNDFQSVFSDLRSIGGDVVDIIYDSKQFFTQLGALVGVFGTLVNTGSNAVGDYQNGKFASSFFNLMLLFSVQLPTISAMVLVFFKDKINLSLKGLVEVKEDIKELMDDLESLMGSEEDEEESDNSYDDPADSLGGGTEMDAPPSLRQIPKTELSEERMTESKLFLKVKNVYVENKSNNDDDDSYPPPKRIPQHDVLLISSGPDFKQDDKDLPIIKTFSQPDSDINEIILKSNASSKHLRKRKRNKKDSFKQDEIMIQDAKDLKQIREDNTTTVWSNELRFKEMKQEKQDNKHIHLEGNDPNLATGSNRREIVSNFSTSLLPKKSFLNDASKLKPVAKDSLLETKSKRNSSHDQANDNNYTCTANIGQSKRFKGNDESMTHQSVSEQAPKSFSCDDNFAWQTVSKSKKRRRLKPTTPQFIGNKCSILCKNNQSVTVITKPSCASLEQPEKVNKMTALTESAPKTVSKKSAVNRYHSMTKAWVLHHHGSVDEGK